MPVDNFPVPHLRTTRNNTRQLARLEIPRRDLFHIWSV